MHTSMADLQCLALQIPAGKTLSRRALGHCGTAGALDLPCTWAPLAGQALGTLVGVSWFFPSVMFHLVPRVAGNSQG